MTLEQLAGLLKQACDKAGVNTPKTETVERIQKDLQDEPEIVAFFHEFGQLYGAMLTADLNARGRRSS